MWGDFTVNKSEGSNYWMLLVFTELCLYIYLCSWSLLLSRTWRSIIWSLICFRFNSFAFRDFDNFSNVSINKSSFHILMGLTWTAMKKSSTSDWHGGGQNLLANSYLKNINIIMIIQTKANPKKLFGVHQILVNNLRAHQYEKKVPDLSIICHSRQILP